MSETCHGVFVDNVTPPSHQAESSVLPSTRTKRKWDLEEDNYNYDHPIKLQALSHIVSSESVLAYAQVTLPRTNLPLTFINTTEEHRLFGKSNLIIIEDLKLAETLKPTPTDPNIKICILKLQGKDCLYALENVANEVFGIVSLAPWVRLGHLQLNTLPTFPLGLRQIDVASSPANDGCWWQSHLLGHQTQKVTTKRQRDDEPRAQTRPSNKKQRNKATTEAQSEPQLQKQYTHAPVSVTQDQHQEEIFASIIHNYLEALYVSKTSLAYFAKGPLSRARATFTDTRVKGNVSELITFLRSLVLSASVMDKKYKEGVPAVIRKEIARQLAQPDSGATTLTKATKRRRKPKLKVGKDGLFPDEASYIARTLANDQSDIFGAGTSDATSSLAMVLRYSRFRESLLQWIIMLEIMSLEQNSPSSDLSLPSDFIDDLSKPNEQSSKTDNLKKPKRPLDLQSATEALIDRLTIWQSVEVGSEVSSKKDTASQQFHGVHSRQLESRDHLREFCREVVRPFYSSRLPYLVEKMLQRVGISTASSLSRPGTSLSNSKRFAPPPGSDVSRHAASKLRKPFSRVLSDTGIAQTVIPSLIRSSTDSLLQNIKRETSVTPQPAKETESARSRPLSRSSSISHAKMFSQREVDLGAIAKFNETKSKRMGNVEQELKDAIATLKKPNRATAVKEYVEAVDSRRAKLLSKAPALLGVQVNATPKKSKKFQSISLTPQRPSTTHDDEHGVPTARPASSNPCVPSTAVRVPNIEVECLAPDSGLSTQSWIFETPSRLQRQPSLKPGQPIPLPNPGIVPASSIKPRSKKVAPLPSSYIASPAFLNARKEASRDVLDSDGVIPFSARKQHDPKRTSELHKSSPINVADVSKLSGSRWNESSVPVLDHESIYERLGWHDDVDELA